jgi:hypothetical protein
MDVAEDTDPHRLTRLGGIASNGKRYIEELHDVRASRFSSVRPAVRPSFSSFPSFFAPGPAWRFGEARF